VGEFTEIQRRTVHNIHALLSQKVLVAVTKIPFTLNQILSPVFFIAAFVAGMRLGWRHEILALKSVGLSKWRMLSPFLAVVFILSSLNVLVWQPLSMRILQYSKKTEGHVTQRALSDQLKFFRSGIWIRKNLSEGRGYLIAHLPNISSKNKNLDQLSLYVFERGEEVKQSYQASSAQPTSHGLLLNNAWVMTEKGFPVFEKTLTVPYQLNVHDFIMQNLDPRFIGFWQLGPLIEAMKRSGIKTYRYQLARHRLLASVPEALVLTFLGGLVGIHLDRRYKKSLPIFLFCFLLVLLFFFLGQLMQILGQNGTLSAFEGAWIPFGFLFLIVLIIAAFWGQEKRLWR
jgi:lipopolysaccharide export LptBFGC system permease protein LptF